MTARPVKAPILHFCNCEACLSRYNTGIDVGRFTCLLGHYPDPPHLRRELREFYWRQTCALEPMLPTALPA